MSDLTALEVVRDDFDRIARALTDPDAIDRDSQALIDRLPHGLGAVLEVGCGTGAVARLLADRHQHVLAIDLSSEMIAIAKQLSLSYDNLDFERRNVLEGALPASAFDAIVSVATLHHLPLESSLTMLATALAPGGVLLVLDLFDATGLRELPYNLLSLASRRLQPRGRATPKLAQAWAAHGAHDHLLRLPDLERRISATLPGARIERQLGWRYRLEWRRP